jgi:ribosomal protein S18 acetylase RimI-like enzyme
MDELTRNFRDEDLDSIVKIFKKNMYDYILRHYGEWNEDFIRYAIQNASKQIRVLDKGGEVQGFFWTETKKDFLELLEIHVTPSQQKQGLGSQMLFEIESVARNEGFNEIRLWVFRENPAVSFYEYNGYCISENESTEIRYRMRKSIS